MTAAVALLPDVAAWVREHPDTRMGAHLRPVVASSRPVLWCGVHGSPVRFATAVEVSWAARWECLPDPGNDCLWCSVDGRAREVRP